MSYIDNMNGFLEVLDLLDGNEVRFFLHLFKINNRFGWQEWIEVRDTKFMALMDISKPTVYAIRNRLKQKGIIDYKTTPKVKTEYKITVSANFLPKTLPETLPVTLPVTLPESLPLNKNKTKTKEKDIISTDVDMATAPQSSERGERVPYSEMVKVFVEVCTSLPKVQSLSDTRKKYLKSRYEDLGRDMEKWREFCTMVQDSDFLNGKGGRWRASFDWIINHANFQKIREGNYANRAREGGVEGGARTVQGYGGESFSERVSRRNVDEEARARREREEGVDANAEKWRRMQETAQRRTLSDALTYGKVAL